MQSHADYSHEAHLIPRQRGDSNNSDSPALSTKRSMHWPFNSSISTANNSPIDGADSQTPVYPTHSSILRRYASTRSANLLNFTSSGHRRNPSSVSRTRNQGLRHGANPSISTIRTVASSSTLFPVPDYVANYIRGETPETIAMRREERSRGQMNRFPDIREGSMDIEEGVQGEVVGGGSPGNGLGLEIEDGRSKRRCFPSGWRATMSLTLILAVLLIIATAVTTALTAIKHSDTFWTSESPLLTSKSCSTIRSANQGVHGVAAAFGILLVAGAGHAAQVLGAPSRNNVDKAHGDGKRLDVGRGLSIRNLKVVNMGRVLISLLAVIAAIGTLVALNALVFTTGSSTSTDLDDFDPSECSLTLDGALLGVILISLVLTAGTLIVGLARPTFKPLLTIGDAIASFASRPDATMRHSTGSITMDATGRGTPSGQALVGGHEMRSTRWMSTVSVGRWVLWLATWTVPFALAMAALILSFASSSEAPRFALGEPRWTLESPIGSSRSALVILVSLPQILTATLYLSTSALLTAFFSARELGGYDAAAKAAKEEGGVVRLRVSGGGLGTQTTSMYATLPPVVSVVLWGVFTAVGFLVSQSLTLVAIDGPDGKNTTGVGLTPLALIVVVGILAALALAVLSMAMFCHSDVPRNMDGSQAIASLCRSWGAASEEQEMREQPRAQLRQRPEGSHDGSWRGDGERVVSWGAFSEAPGTIASGKWMAAGR